MIEHVYDALAGNLFNDWPKNNSNRPVVYNRPIRIWNLGDRDIKADGTISITFQSKNSDNEQLATGSERLEHSIAIEVKAQGLKPEESERLTQETSRLLYAKLKNRRRLWVLTQCPICLKGILSPKHYLLDHSNVFQSYADQIVSEFEAEWNSTHNLLSAPVYELQNDRMAGLATEAFYRVYEEVRNNQSVTNLSTNARNAMEVALENEMQPIRLLTHAKLSGSASEGSAGKQLLATGQWNWTAKEISLLNSFGPDENTPTGSWEL